MDLNPKIPIYITERKNLTGVVIFTAVFALIFINLYSPFEVNTLIINKAGKFLKVENRSLLLLISSSLIILTGVLIIVVSRIILYHKTKKSGNISLSRYIIWIVSELILMAALYAVYEIIFLNDPRAFLVSFKVSIQNTALVLLLPYSISWLYLSWLL